MFIAAVFTAQQATGEGIYGCYGGIYYGAGLGLDHSENSVKYEPSGSNAAKRACRLGGVMVLGNGKTADSYPIYYGGEVTVNCARLKHDAVSAETKYFMLKSNGITPSLAFRAGIISRNEGTLFFIKFGIGRRKISLKYENDKLATVQLVPTFGAGMERIMTGNCTYRIEAEYRVKTDKSGNIGEMPGRHSIENGKCFGINAMICYHFGRN
jgi:hypothetical protein